MSIPDIRYLCALLTTTIRPNMSGENVSGPPLPTSKTGKPVSEALLNEKASLLCPPYDTKSRYSTSRIDLPAKVPFGTKHEQRDSNVFHRHVLSVRNTAIQDYTLTFRTTVGPRDFLPSYSVRPRLLLRRHILSTVIQAKSVAGMDWNWFRSWKGVGRS